MNARNLFISLVLLVGLIVLTSPATFAAQLATVYVDVTNGNLSYDGSSPTATGGNVGPKATIGGGLSVLDNNGTLYITAGTYLGVDGASGNVNIATGTYAALTTGLTIRLVPLKDPLGVILSTNVNLTAGSFIVNLTGASPVLNIVSQEATVLNQTNTTVTLTSGNINLDAATSWVLASGTTIGLVDAFGFTNARPTKTTSVSLSYTDTGINSFTAGAESNFGSYGAAGSITVNKTAGGTITFPNAITAIDGIILTSGNATFSAAVTHVPSATNLDITNNGTGTLTFGSTLGLGVKDGTTDANLSSIENTTTGSIIVTGTTTWTGPSALTANRDFAGVYGIVNSGASPSSVSLGAVSLVANDGATFIKSYIFEARNSSTGTLTIGAVTATVGSAAGANYGAMRVTGTATAGTINLSGGVFRGFITNLGTHTLNVNGAANLLDSFVGADGIFTNAGSTVLNANLTLNGALAVAHVTFGGTVTGSGTLIAAPSAAVTVTFSGGGLGNFEVNAPSATAVNIITNAFTANTMTLTAGTVGLNIAGTTANMNVVGASATVATTIIQTVTNFTQSGGVFVLTAGTTTTLDVKGNFNRTGGTFTANPVSLVSFTGTSPQTVNGGSLFQTDLLTFNNIGGIITIGNSIRATGNVLITTTTNLALSTLNIILNGATNSITNNGQYSSTGGGGVIVGGITTVVGGLAGNGYSIVGTGTYSNITIDVGSTLGADLGPTANTVASPTVITTGVVAHGLVTGDVVYFSGSANIPASFYVVTWLSATTFSIPVNALADDAGTYTVKQINTAKVTNPTTGVKWSGILALKTGALSVSTASVDFGPTGATASIARYPETAAGIYAISTASFNAASTPYDLIYTGAITANRSVGAELTATPTNVRTWTISTTGAFNNDLPATASVNFGGTLVVSDGAFLRIPTNGAAVTFTLSGASKTHTIAGTLVAPDAADAFIFSGSSSIVNGSIVVADAATIGNVRFNGTSQTVANVQLFSGTVTTGASSTVTFGMGAAATEQIITGLLTLGGTNFTLTTNINPRAGITHNAGVLDFGANTVNLTVGGAFLQTAGSYASTGGYLQFSIAGNLTLTSALPYLKANNVAITLLSAATISQNLDIAGATPAGTITSGGFNLTIQNTMTTNAGPAGGIFTGAGNLILSGAAPTITASVALTAPTISNLTINSSGTATLASSIVPAAGVTFTISGVLTHTAGNLVTTINSVVLTGAGAVYTRATATGQITETTGVLSFKGGAAQSATQGTGFTVTNLTIDNSAATAGDVTFLGGATNDFIVTGTLSLTTGTFSSTTAGKLHIGSLATIERFSTASSLVEIPAFDGDVNLSYRGLTGGIGAKEMPTAASNKLNNMLVNLAGANTFALAANASLKGTLTLTAGTFNAGTGPFTLTMASGTTLVIGGGIMGFIPTVTSYSVTYKTASVTTTDKDLQNGTGITVTLMTVNPGSGNTVTLNKAKTVNNLTITSGTLANGGFNLTLLGNFNGAGGAFTGTGALILNGITAQTITTPAGDYTLGGNLTINNTAGDVTLVGGNLKVSGTVTFTKGILRTGSNILYLAAPTTLAVSGGTQSQGFVGASATSHVVGNVAKTLINTGDISTSTEAVNIFPVGNGVVYRPATLTFNAASGVPTSPNATIVVSHVDLSPGGFQNLPIANGVSAGVAVSRYPSFYWSIYTIGSVGPSTVFDLSLTGGTTFTDYDSPSNVRIIRRNGAASDIANDWLLQGVNTGYDNQVNGVTGFTAVDRNSVAGLLITPGAVFTYGMKTRLVASTFADVVIGKVGGVYVPNPYKVALAGKFTNGVGTLTYLAASSNPAVATAWIVVGDTLKVYPLTDGSTSISVKATDANNDFVTVAFNVQMRSTGVGGMVELPKEFSLKQNYPNPFNPTTNISFDVPQNSSVKIAIYDMLGREVATLVNTNYTPGYYTVPFNASKLASGMYIYRMSSQSLSGDQKMFTSTKKLMLVK
jgi:hypothetical protein